MLLDLSGMTQPGTAPNFFIGSLPVYGDLVLSPMDGFSDLPFRSLCRRLGSALSYTEFVNALDVLQDHPRLPQRLAYLPEEHPVVFQIFDSEPERLLAAALRLQEFGPDIIDINMGCSARCVVGRGAGAGLLRTPARIVEIFNKLSHSLTIPVTGKIRLGWDDDHRNYLQVARIIEDNGGAMIAVHGRTQRQGYGGQADWEAIAEIRQAVSIPVLANGDVRTVADIERVKALTNCQGVMIGRGAVGNPWIFSRLDREQVSPEQVRQLMLLHMERMLSFYGEQLGLLRFRKHASRYLTPFTLSPAARRGLLEAEKPHQFIALLDVVIAESFV
jgi:nifR3 family TIM-barrel protein